MNEGFFNLIAGRAISLVNKPRSREVIPQTVLGGEKNASKAKSSSDMASDSLCREEQKLLTVLRVMILTATINHVAELCGRKKEKEEVPIQHLQALRGIPELAVGEIFFPTSTVLHVQYSLDLISLLLC